MSEELQEDTPKNSKEIWLFLIFVDIIALCVFGYFIYRSFFNSFDISSFMTAAVEEEYSVEEVEIPQEPAPALKKEPVKHEASAPVAQQHQEPVQEAKKETLQKDEYKEEIKAEEAKTAEPVVRKEESKPLEPVVKKEEAKPAELVVKKEEAKPAKAEPKRQSVFVSGTGKTRKVMFKYYGNAKSVSIVSGFTMSKPVPLKKTGKEWATTLVIYPGQYKYMFIVDGKQIPDPNASKQVDGRSIVTIK